MSVFNAVDRSMVDREENSRILFNLKPVIADLIVDQRRPCKYKSSSSQTPLILLGYASNTHKHPICSFRNAAYP